MNLFWQISNRILVFLVIALAVNIISILIESTYLSKFLHDNIINLLLALLAINVASISIVLSKLKEISDRNDNYDFTESYNLLKISLLEQVILIIAAIIFSICKDSEWIRNLLKYHDIIFDTLLTVVLIYAIDVLYDIGMATFIITGDTKKK